MVKKWNICWVSVITWQHIFIKPRGLITLLWYARLLIDIVNYAGCWTRIPHEILSTYFVSEAFSHIPWPSSADSYFGDGSIVLKLGLKDAKMASEFFFLTRKIMSQFFFPSLHCFYIGSCTCVESQKYHNTPHQYRMPLISWLCDITRCHHVTHLHNLYLFAQLFCCCKQLWLRRVWADQSEDTGYSVGSLKETAAFEHCCMYTSIVVVN